MMMRCCPGSVSIQLSCVCRAAWKRPAGACALSPTDAAPTVATVAPRPVRKARRGDLREVIVSLPRCSEVRLKPDTPYGRPSVSFSDGFRKECIAKRSERGDGGQVQATGRRE